MSSKKPRPKRAKKRPPINRADAKANWAALAELSSECAAIRRELGDADMPEDVGESINRTRQLLLDAGLPQAVVDTTPGYEPIGFYK